MDRTRGIDRAEQMLINAIAKQVKVEMGHVPNQLLSALMREVSKAFQFADDNAASYVKCRKTPNRPG